MLHGVYAGDFVKSVVDEGDSSEVVVGVPCVFAAEVEVTSVVGSRLVRGSKLDGRSPVSAVRSDIGRSVGRSMFIGKEVGSGLVVENFVEWEGSEANEVVLRKLWGAMLNRLVRECEVFCNSTERQ